LDSSRQHLVLLQGAMLPYLLHAHASLTTPYKPSPTAGQWNLVAESGHTSGRLAPGQNVYVADLSPWIPAGANVYGVRENGNRQIRARYPNANPELGFGSSLQAVSWVPSVLPTNPDVEVGGCMTPVLGDDGR
jgi:hypothetical protein